MKDHQDNSTGKPHPLSIKIAEESMRRNFGKPSMSDEEFQNLKGEWIKALPAPTQTEESELAAFLKEYIPDGAIRTSEYTVVNGEWLRSEIMALLRSREADIRKEAQLSLIDHLIMNADTFKSFNKRDLENIRKGIDGSFMAALSDHSKGDV